MDDIKRQTAGEPGRERGQGEPAGKQPAEGATAEAARTGSKAQRTGVALGEHLVGQGGEKVAEGARGAADLMRRSAEAGHRGGEMAEEAARHGLQAAAAGQHEVLRDAAQEMEQTGQRLAWMAQETAERMRTLMAMPGLNGENLRAMQRAMAQIVDGVATTNMRLMQELLRRNGPSGMVALQHRFLCDYFDALAEGGSGLLRATRRAAEESLRPLERQMQRRDGMRGPDGQDDGQNVPVKDMMTREIRVAKPEDTVQQVARIMAEEDAGVMPVAEGDRLVGMITDRDLAVRLVATGRDASRTQAHEVMTPELRYVFEDEPISHAADIMAEQQLHRLPVLSREKRLVGIVSVGDIARRRGDAAGRAMQGIARPEGQHSQRGQAQPNA